MAAIVPAVNNIDKKAAKIAFRIWRVAGISLGFVQVDRNAIKANMECTLKLVSTKIRDKIWFFRRYKSPTS